MLRGAFRSQLCFRLRPFCSFSKLQPESASRASLTVGEGELTRDFLAASLQGYYNTKDVASPPRTNFSALADKKAYAALQQKIITEKPYTMATAVELFSPYYSEAIARWIVQDHLVSKSTEPLCVFEIGGGTGKGALDILNYIRNNYPQLYASMTYHTVESSSLLVNKQKEILSEAGHKNVEIIHMDILDWNSDRFVNKYCHILALEVLGNLPHDKIKRNETDVRQAHVYAKTEYAMEEDEQGAEKKEKSMYCEALQPLSDPLIQECLSLFDAHPLEEFSYANFSRNGLIGSKKLTANPWLRKMFEFFKERRDEDLFLPTGTLRLMKIIKQYFPQHSILVADIDFIVEMTTGHYAPVIAQTRSPFRDHAVSDYFSHLIEVGKADIHHPLSFPLLKYMYDELVKNGDTSSKLIAQDGFLHIWAQSTNCNLQNGYNPMMMDFAKRIFYRGRTNLQAPPSGK